ncbi:amphoterin-induced protein 3 isoform X1 [Austrofundulus limnaeus]|uniref:Amphoterin-induced protein 3 isoform X1 n=1 Tax=Austrofundulus limnaeus TaxID=52670 RepID=A0A2I4BNK1_AUSLI|nr:PREDICTED: amphoterin-induced protein 3-like isoform X1 [Austrofundulus limnaeus]
MLGGLTGFLHGVEPTASPWSVVVLMFCLNLGPAQASTCPSQCLCTSDLLSCTDLGLAQVPEVLPVFIVTLDLNHNRIVQLEEESFEGLPHLEMLRLAHNQVTSIQSGAFRNSSGSLLRHLDLSSNQLMVLEQHYFQDLPGLQELLLFNNRIVRVETGALNHLKNIHKVYLSHNLLTTFPFFSIQKHSHPNLTMLDLSSNRLPKLPLKDISNLPQSVQEGLYLHNNSLLCDCSMYSLFRFWEQMDFASIRFFRQEHVCLLYGIPRGVRFFLYNRFFDGCRLLELKQQSRDVSVRAGARLLLHCITSLSGTRPAFFWLAPNSEYVTPPGNNGSLNMFPNGSLEIVAAREEDSGIYLCMTQDQDRNETGEVNVTVLRHEDEAHEHFNTGFTTLLGCVVSLLLVLMYLYLTPCRCPKHLPPPTAALSRGKEAGPGSAQSSILTPTPPTTTEGPGRKMFPSNIFSFLPCDTSKPTDSLYL